MILLLILSAVAVFGQKAPQSFLEKRVTFTIPDHWQIQRLEDSKTLGRTQIMIPYALTDNTPHSANAAIVAHIVPDNMTVKDVGDRIAKQPIPTLAIVNDIPDGENWRTIVWTARTEGLPYLILSRFGVVHNVAVEFTVGFPLFENGDAKWIERAVADFNTTCETLKIDGTNSTKANVFIDKLPTKN
jgi:hypothetical protein